MQSSILIRHLLCKCHLLLLREGFTQKNFLLKSKCCCCGLHTGRNQFLTLKSELDTAARSFATLEDDRGDGFIRQYGA